MNYAEIVKRCILEEEAYQFSRFTQTDALHLGRLLYETGLEKFGKPVAAEIRINHLTVYRFLPEGTGRVQCLWLKAKADTVDALGISTYHLWADIAGGGLPLEDRRMDGKKYVAAGGGFPLHIKNSAVMGTICVSALTQEEDHQVVIGALGKYFKKQKKA